MINEDKDLKEDIEKSWKDVSNLLEKQVNDELNLISKKKKHRLLRQRILIAFGSILILGIIFAISPFGKKMMIRMAGNYVYGKLEIDNSTKNSIGAGENKEIETSKNISEGYINKNILLLGVEEIKGASNTDAIIIASLNSKEKTLKMTSLMRDLYVEISGFSNNKLNSVYSKGGINLLYDTIEAEFGVPMDGYILVNFNSLENIVDYLNGIEIKLTKDEADYLNAKNYISKPENRKVVEGTQIMNGNQVLGYCRVRYVSTGTECDDFGRTQRQRLVLNAIYKKIKKLNIFQLTSFMNKVLSNENIKTDISRDDFNDYLEQSVNIMNDIKISQYRVPANNAYENQKILIGKRKKAVLVIKDPDAVRKDLRNFIYGTDQ